MKQLLRRVASIGSPGANGRRLVADLGRRWLCRTFHSALNRQTGNFSHIKWLGVPIWQNVLDLWTIQETIFEVKPELLIECGTNRGGSSYFFAHLFDLIGRGRVISIDIEKMHDLSHPRVSYLIGSSVDSQTVEKVRHATDSASGPVLVILDSDHRQQHVQKELEIYHRFVTPGSYLLVQDGVIDVLPMFSPGRPGPLPAVEAFLRQHPEFELDQARCDRFLITHHPKGWLRRRTHGVARTSEPVVPEGEAGEGAITAPVPRAA